MQSRSGRPFPVSSWVSGSLPQASHPPDEAGRACFALFESPRTTKVPTFPLWEAAFPFHPPWEDAASFPRNGRLPAREMQRLACLQDMLGAF